RMAGTADRSGGLGASVGDSGRAAPTAREPGIELGARLRLPMVDSTATGRGLLGDRRLRPVHIRLPEEEDSDSESFCISGLHHRWTRQRARNHRIVPSDCNTAVGFGNQRKRRRRAPRRHWSPYSLGVMKTWLFTIIATITFVDFVSGVVHWAEDTFGKETTS